MKLRFSVFVSAWNFERFIEQCLWSIASQDYHDFEVIVGLDAPTDGTAEKVRRACLSEARVRMHIVEHPVRLYPLGNMLAMLPHATGDVGLRVDGDDYLLSAQALSRIAREYEDPEVDMTHGSFVVMPQFTFACAAPWSGRFDRWCFLHPITWRVPLARMCVTEHYMEDGPYRDESGSPYKVAGDVAWTYPIAAHARKIATIQEPLYAYRMHPGNEQNYARAEQLAVEARVGPYWQRFLDNRKREERTA